MADTTTPPKGPKEPRLLKLPVANAAPDTPDHVVWAGRKADDVAPVAEARAKAVGLAEDEYRRLLYVAMTRAADRLVVAGSRGVNRIPDGCWYQLIERALKPVENTPKREGAEEPSDDGDGTVWRWRRNADEVIAQGGAASAPTATHDVPDWLKRNAPTETEKALKISPSRTGAPSGRAKYHAADPHALARGRTVHRLLQALPAFPIEKRAEAARKYFTRAKDLPDTERIAAEVLALLHDARLASLFSERSRAEVPIVGIVSHGEQRQKVSGQVDRLAVTSSECSDRRLQVGPYGTGHNARHPARLHPPARALSRSAAAHLSESPGARRAGLDRRTGAHGTTRRAA